MDVLKFDLRVPFWCSFKYFGTVNIQQTYSFPPPPTIFGMIQNALGKTIIPKTKEKRINEGYENLNFGIVIRQLGEKLDDYTNIMKGNRDQKKSREALEDKLKKETKKRAKELKKEGLSEKEIEDNIKEEEIKFRKKWKDKIGKYDIDKKWMRTQIRRQRLIAPYYTIYVTSKDDNEFSLENISKALKNPKRPLYLGENDDLVSVKLRGNGIVEAKTGIYSKNIKSIIPGIYENSTLEKIPISVGETKNTVNKITVSIPKDEINKSISCIDINGENIVFLR